MKVLVVGSGGREHALAYKASQSELVEQVFVAPGNAGTALETKVSNVKIAADDIAELLKFALNEEIGLTIIGPEAPLVLGVVDQFAAAGLDCFGPTSAAAQLEGSKSFAKAFLARHSIPTAAYQSFTVAADAIQYLDQGNYPIVIKADGLAAGKGVIIASNRSEAGAAVEDMLSGNAFGEAGSRVVIEEFMVGEEASFICIVDGTDVLPMASSQDHKAAHDGDIGPNTGGMGAYSPSPLVDDEMYERIMHQVIMPTVRGMEADGNRYRGFLYAGLMIGADGIPRVVEFNCRFGDPEAQPVLSRLRSDLVSHCHAAVQGTLDTQSAVWDDQHCLGVVLAAAGYPDSYNKGHIIQGLEQQIEGTQVFHAGTTLDDNNNVVTSGGRVLCVTGHGDSVAAAQALAYQRIAGISWKGSWCRQDIGHKAIARETS